MLAYPPQVFTEESWQGLCRKATDKFGRPADPKVGINLGERSDTLLNTAFAFTGMLIFVCQMWLLVHSVESFGRVETSIERDYDLIFNPAAVPVTEREKLEQIFQKFDEDKDGFLNEDEMAAFMRVRDPTILARTCSMYLCGMDGCDAIHSWLRSSAGLTHRNHG